MIQTDSARDCKYAMTTPARSLEGRFSTSRSPGPAPASPRSPLPPRAPRPRAPLHLPCLLAFLVSYPSCAIESLHATLRARFTFAGPTDAEEEEGEEEEQKQAAVDARKEEADLHRHEEAHAELQWNSRKSTAPGGNVHDPMPAEEATASEQRSSRASGHGRRAGRQWTDALGAARGSGRRRQMLLYVGRGGGGVAGDIGGAGHGLLVFISGVVAAGPNGRGRGVAHADVGRGDITRAPGSAALVTASAGTGEVPDGGDSDPPASRHAFSDPCPRCVQAQHHP